MLEEGGGKRIDVTYMDRSIKGCGDFCAAEVRTIFVLNRWLPVTNGINLFAGGKYPELQWIGPGDTWSESLWVSASSGI